MSEDTSLRIKRQTRSYMAILQKQMGFHSADEFLWHMLKYINHMKHKRGLSKTDLYIVANKKIPVVTVEAGTDKEALKQSRVKLDKELETLKFVEKYPIESKVAKKFKEKK